jgi:hypothetical protein
VRHEWSVAIEAHGDYRREDDDLADEILEKLAGRDPSVSSGHGVLNIRFDVVADGAEPAFFQAWQLVQELLPNIEPDRFYLETVEDQERHLMESNAPDLLGVAEVAELLGVTKQRASDLARSDDFPSPIATLRAGPIWRRSQLARFVGGWSRQPGRPRRDPDPQPA